KFAGAGASVPLLGFGYALAKGAVEAVDKTGAIGIFTGGITATSGGVGAAIFFGYIMAVIFNPKTKK
ncbi:MAG: SpoVA/SpoVAEb family sporulation membrane protein, partial [Senegalia sp. (in: firmicutes)]